MPVIVLGSADLRAVVATVEGAHEGGIEPTCGADHLDANDPVRRDASSRRTPWVAALTAGTKTSR